VEGANSLSKVALTTLGCKVNQFETEVMEGLFKKRGYETVPFSEEADFYVINTCSVTSLGEKKSRQLIRRAQRLNPQAIIAVTGCYSQLSPESIKAIEGVRVVIGTKERGRIVDLVEQAAGEKGILTKVTDIMQAKEFEDIPLFDMPERTRAFLKIQEGCSNFCSYCIIPYARGPLRSRHIDSVLREAKKLVAAGFKEVVLTGIHLGAYGRDLAEDISLVDAARAVLSIPELKRLRLGSLESIELSPELFDLICEDKRFSKHLHLPLQAGSDDVLRMMNRHYTAAQFAALIDHVESTVPGVAVSTDIIVGFPGETEKMFADGLAFVEKMNFARMHVFPYSKRTGTPAATMPDQVAESVKKDRAHRMQQLADRKAAEFHAGFIDKTVEVLIESDHKGVKDGLTGNYIRVYVDDEAACGEIYSVHLEKFYKDGLWGNIC
jgi:threonylcarbamoyladenosine tRNA methylthiotransferase MtaB